MISDQVFHPGFWFVLLIILTAALPLYVFILWRSWKLAIVFLVVFLFFGLYLAFYSARNFGGAFGTGMALTCLSALLMPISLILWLLLRHPFKRKFAGDARQRRLYALGSMLIILMQLFPILGSFAINAGCFSISRSHAAQLIASIKAYQQQNGLYPLNPTELIPAYLPELPAPACKWLSGDEYRAQVGFELVACPEGEYLLTNFSMDGTYIERYQFATGKWSSISFLDGACNFLP